MNDHSMRGKAKSDLITKNSFCDEMIYCLVESEVGRLICTRYLIEFKFKCFRSSTRVVDIYILISQSSTCIYK